MQRYLGSDTLGADPSFIFTFENNSADSLNDPTASLAKSAASLNEVVDAFRDEIGAELVARLDI